MQQNKLRFIAALGVLLVFGFMMTSLTSYYAAHDTLSEQISETSLPLTSDNIYSEIQRDLLQPIFISSLMAQDTFLRDWTIGGETDPDQVIRYLREIQDEYRTVTSFFVSDTSRKYYHPNGIIKTVDEKDPLDNWYFDFLSSKKEFEINLDFDTSNPNSMTVFINYRIHDYLGNLIGVTGVGLALEQVQNRIASYQKRFGRRVSFIDRDGTIMLSNTDDYRGSSIRETNGLKKIATQILASPSGTYSYERAGKTVYLNARLVEEFQWYLLVEQEEEAVEEKILDNLTSNLIVSFVISLIVLAIANFTINRYQNRLEQMATTDPLTGVANRHVFETIFEQISKSSQRNDTKVSVIMLDVDHFKQVNDKYGHNAGDLALKSVVKTIKERLRDSDTVCRWGGEEFLIILPDCDLKRAEIIAENIRKSIQKRVILYGQHDINLTVSMGITEYIKGEDTISLINRVDETLYQSKGSGRNRVSISPIGS
jgi:diguanylate cyclase (GGDEF)-like protein